MQHKENLVIFLSVWCIPCHPKTSWYLLFPWLKMQKYGISLPVSFRSSLHHKFIFSMRTLDINNMWENQCCMAEVKQINSKITWFPIYCTISLKNDIFNSTLLILTIESSELNFFIIQIFQFLFYWYPSSCSLSFKYILHL